MTAGVRTIAVSAGLAWLAAVWLDARGVGPRQDVRLAQASSSRAAGDVTPARRTLDAYCVSCHNDRLKTAGLSLTAGSVDEAPAHPEVWEKVVRKLRSRTMPPAGSRRPDEATYDSLATALESALDKAAVVRPNPGSVPAHRLNRAEYSNAIRDLLALEVDSPSLLPVDDSNHGFDNIAATLSFSPALLDRYMAAARRISRLAVGDPTIGPGFTSKTYVVPKTAFQDDRMSEDLPFGSRGGTAIRHHFPLDGVYTVQIRLRRNLYDYVRGVREPHRLEVRLDGARLREFIVGGEANERPAPVSFAGNIPGSAEWEAYALAADAGLELKVPAKAGTRTLGVSFVGATVEAEGVLQPPLTGFAFTVDESASSPAGAGPAVEAVTIGGPYEAGGPGDTPSRRRIFSCRPAGAADEDRCASTILGTIARRAYRRPLTGDDRRTLDEFYEAGRRDSGFEGGVRRGLERILVDPDFLFRIDQSSAARASGSAAPISDLDLASRLSFFLWSSIPDDALVDLAVRGRLREPAVLERQVRRMLADPRSRALVQNFAAQWLGLRNMRGVAPDPELFEAFDDNLRDAFVKETELFLESQLRDDRSIVDLLTADYTFVNERLARHYGMTGVHGSQFRRVKVNPNERGGILGQGSILTVTSYGTRTSPVLRGHWLLENVLGSPPPPPPADVPGLRERNDAGKVLSLRARMEQHRKSPACAGCHVRMDPLGFALENFDAIGRWRTIGEDGTAIDPSGSLPDGSKFNGLTGLRSFLVTRRHEFVRTAVEKLLTYALGRGVEHYDAPAVRQIVREASRDGQKWSSLILSVVKSTPFQMRRTEP
jgi:hypothetical protein